MNDETKKWIDGASYETLLDLWRNGPSDDPIFHGKTGDYLAKAMAEKRAQVGPEEAVRISKAIGWRGDEQ